MKKLAVAAVVFAALAAIVIILLWPAETSGRRIVALGQDADARSVAATLADLHDGGMLGGAALALLGAGGSFDAERGALVLDLGLAAVALPVEDASHVLVSLQEGTRREEMALVFANKLNWTDDQRAEFEGGAGGCQLLGAEGYLFPDRYLMPRDAQPVEVLTAMERRFYEVYGRLAEAGDAIIDDPQTVARIAALIQREAAGKNDMALISGVIWNRVNAGMPLQIDATLQYAKGAEGRWWPSVRSKDKGIDSPFNSYRNDGLPPGAIANAGEAAIEAAMRPDDTACLFYIHDRNRTIHCASDYATHKQNIRWYL